MADEAKDYLKEIEQFKPLGISQYGYVVSVEKYATGGGIRVKLTYNKNDTPEEVGVVSISFTDYNSRVKSWEALNREIHREILAKYDAHNQKFDRDELLKALEDRLNGKTGMLVLTPDVPSVEDGQFGVITAGQIRTKPVESKDEPGKHTWLGSFL